MEGKVTRVGASQPGGKRVSNEREDMSQEFRSLDAALFPNGPQKCWQTDLIALRHRRGFISAGARA